MMPLTVIVVILLCLISGCDSFPFPRPLRDPVTYHHNPHDQHHNNIDNNILNPNDYAYQWETYYYDSQTVDHFGFTNSDVFRQKYLVNSISWLTPASSNGPGPIFFYCGNEGPIETFANNTGLMFDMAAEFNAMIVFAEHRYYGTSFPYNNETIAYSNTSTLQYLTSEQAIADYVQFLQWFTTNVSADGPCKGNCSDIPIVAFGGSYGGMLASWLRIKYPWSVVGAIASSAPIWQQPGLAPPTVFNHIITQTFGQDVANCPIGINRSWAILDSMGNSSTGLTTLTSIFKPCPLGSSFDAYNYTTIAGQLSNAYAYMAMADYPYPTDFLGSMPAYPVKYACQQAFGSMNLGTASDTDILNAVNIILNVFTNYSGNISCQDMSSQGPSTLGNTLDGWAYQVCTEMVQPIGSYGLPNDMFPYQPYNMTNSIISCSAPFSPFNYSFGTIPRPYWLGLEYGAIHIEAASRIIFTNGNLDPWSGGGVNDTVLNGLYAASNTKGVISLSISPAAHHLDLRGKNDADPASVQWVRNQERQYIQAWIDGYDTPDAENATAGLDTKWVVLISVFATLLTIIIAAALFHFCKTKKKANEDDTVFRANEYEAMTNGTTNR